MHQETSTLLQILCMLLSSRQHVLITNGGIWMQSGIPAAYASSLAIQQWAGCSLFPAPAGPEFCNWAHAVEGIPTPYNQLNASLAATLVPLLTGDRAKYTATCEPCCAGPCDKSCACNHAAAVLRSPAALPLPAP